MRTLDRRGFLLMAGLTTAAVASPAAASGASRDLTGWTTVVGDGVYAAPGQAEVGAADIACQNTGGYSRLRANVRNRGVMAHAIAYRKMTGSEQLTVTHRAGFDFRLPHRPTAAGGPWNGQTVEGGLFVWDGTVDHGTAFQWVVNPWAPDFGRLSVWTGTAWTIAGRLRPDTGWHRLACTLDPVRRRATLTIDGRDLGAPYSLTPKPGWDPTVAARLQAEVISLYPGAAATSAPQHEAHVRNPTWTRRR